MRNLSALLLAAALAGSPAAAQMRAAPVVSTVRVPPAVGLLGVFRAGLERGLGLPAGASAPIPLPQLHLRAVSAQRSGTAAEPILSPAAHAKMALIVRALEAPAARTAPAPMEGPEVRASLSAMERALSGLSVGELKDPAVARAAAASLWDGLAKRPAAPDPVPGAARAGRPARVLAPPAPAARWPLVTAGLLAANVVVYAAPGQDWFLTADWRLSLPTLAAAFDAGGWPGLLGASRAFASSLFLHADSGHLIHNAVGLALLGPVVERAFGHLRTAALFLGAGLAAGALWAAANWGAFMGTMGASGGVMALAGAFFAFFFLDLSKRPSRGGWHEFWMLPACLLASFVVFQFGGDLWGVADRWLHALGIPGHVPGRTNHLSHLAGLLVGLLAARAWLRRPRRA